MFGHSSNVIASVVIRSTAGGEEECGVVATSCHQEPRSDGAVVDAVKVLHRSPSIDTRRYPALHINCAQIHLLSAY